MQKINHIKFKTKICSKCKKRKKIKYFGRDIRTKDKLTYSCKNCINKHRKVWYYIRQSWFKKLKSQYKCSKCPENDPCCIDFHHKNLKNKIDAVARLISTCKPKNVILQEIKKCIPICHNCHRKLHSKPYTTEWKSKNSRTFKENYKCINCNESYYACLDFHHINPDDKLFSINSMTRASKVNWSIIYKEVKKCVCLCSNCHRKLHAGKIKLSKKRT